METWQIKVKEDIETQLKQIYPDVIVWNVKMIDGCLEVSIEVNRTIYYCYGATEQLVVKNVLEEVERTKLQKVTFHTNYYIT